MTSSASPVLRESRARLLVPLLTGMTGSGLLLAGSALSGAAGPMAGAVPILAGAALLGLLIDNPGNEAVLAIGLLGPVVGGVLASGQPPAASMLLAGSLLAGAALLFLGILGGIIARRRWRFAVLPDAGAVALLAVCAAASFAGWLLMPGLAFGDV
jgi:hypothetical protein